MWCCLINSTHTTYKSQLEESQLGQSQLGKNQIKNRVYILNLHIVKMLMNIYIQSKKVNDLYI